ncbi:calmodulin-like [Lineus longissimus]|uniref:calmodulin-like n=1 Tax=Lineus longissimus TaxID=88925 RepID=UPI00315D8FB6
MVSLLGFSVNAAIWRLGAKRLGYRCLLSFKGRSPELDDLSEIEIAVCDEYFRRFDTDHDGLLDVKVLPDLIRSLGQNPSEEEIRIVVEEATFEREGVVDFGEFLYLWAEYRKSKEEQQEELLDAFRMFDKEKKGFVPTNTMKNILTSIGEPMEAEEVEEIFEEVGNTVEGKISYRDIIERVTDRTVGMETWTI